MDSYLARRINHKTRPILAEKRMFPGLYACMPIVGRNLTRIEAEVTASRLLPSTIGYWDARRDEGVVWREYCRAGACSRARPSGRGAA